MSVKTSKPSFASIAATGGASANLKSMLSSPNSITATTGHTSPSTNAPHSITTEHVDRKTGGAYKITKYRDNTSVAGGFTKLGCSGGNSDSKRSSSNRSTPSVPHSQQRTPSPPSLSAKPSNLAARRAAAQSNAPELNSTGSFRKPLAPIAINAPGLLRSELSPASFGSMPHSGGLSPSPTGVTAGRRSPYERPLPSPTNVSPHIASAYYTQSANKGSATYNEDGELEMEEEEAQYMASSSSPFGPPSPMALPAGGLPSSDPNVEMLLAYQTMLAQPSHSGAASNTASLASAYLKYLEAQANFNHFVNSTLEQTAATSNAMPMPSSAASMPAVSLASAAPHLSPEVMAALAQQEQIAAQALKRRPMGMSNPASSPRRPSVSPAPDTSSSPASLFGNVHQTPASSFRYGNRNNAIGSNISPTSSMPLPLPFPAAAAGTPCSPSTWSSRPYGTGAGTNVLATPFSPFDGHPNRYLLSATSTPYTATPGAVSASSSAYSSPLPSPASSTSSLPESDMMRRTESMQSSDSYTSYGSSASGRDVFDSDEKERFAKMAKYGYGGMGSGADTAAAAATAAGQWVSDADWSSNWRRRGPLDYVEPGSLLNLNSSPLGRSASTHSNLHQDFDLGLGKLRLGYPHDMGPTSMATSVSMPGAPLSKSIGLPAMLGEGMRSPYQPKAVGGNRKAALPPTPTLLGQDFVDGLMRTGYSEDESEQQHQQQEQQQQGSLSSGVKASLRASPNMAASPSSNTVLGLSGLQVLNPMAHLDLETPLASNVARF